MRRVLALDTAIHHTGWCLMDEAKGFGGWGSIDTDKEMPTSQRIKTVLEELQTLCYQKGVTHLVVEDVFNKFDVSVTKKLSRLQGAIEYYWLTRTQQPCFRMWTVTARSVLDIPTQAQKVEVLLWADVDRRFLKSEDRTTFVADVKALRFQKKHATISKKDFKNQAKVLANRVAKVSGVTEDMADAYVLAKAFLQIEEKKLGQYQD